MSIEVDPVAKREHQMALQNSLISSHAFPTCTNCVNFDPEGEICTLYKSRPPLKWVVTGCGKWEADIPF